MTDSQSAATARGSSTSKFSPFRVFRRKPRMTETISTEDLKANGSLHSSDATVSSPTQPLISMSEPEDMEKKKKTKKEMLVGQVRAQSIETLHADCADYLTEALQTLGDEQPLVARSIPKHAHVDTSQFAEWSMRNCIFKKEVYDGMMADSLKTCDLLQHELDDLIDHVRRSPPSPTTVPAIHNGH